MTDEQKVDPRYDPAFQRGYQGGVQSTVRTHAAVRRSAVVSPAPYRSVEPEPDVDEHGTEEAEPALAATDEQFEPAHLVPVSRVTMREFVRNPFVVGLILLGGGMIIGGSLWANQGRALVSARGGASTELDYWFLQATVVSAPLTILAGIGILAGVLFLAAGVWNRR
ncbi:MAG: hypothetical protein AB7K08_13800 [Microbacteriaceae bacterium]